MAAVTIASTAAAAAVGATLVALAPPTAVLADEAIAATTTPGDRTSQSVRNGRNWPHTDGMAAAA